MRIKNCQQFVTDKRLVHILGPDGQLRFREIDPLAIQGEFAVELEPMGESQMRQERRAEASQLLQVVSSVAPLAAAAGSPLNIREVLKWYFKMWGHDDSDRFFSQQQAAMGAMGAPGGGGGPAGGGPGSPPGQPNLGITADSAVSATSPSATGGASMSPEVMLQRALAMSGGPANT
jgi:hypothetical protein